MNLINKILLFTLLLIIPLYAAYSQEDKVNTLLQEAQKAEKTASKSISDVLAKWLRVYHEIKEQKNHPQFANVCTSIANIYNNEQLYEQALPFYLEAFQFTSIKNPTNPQAKNLRKSLAKIYALQSKPDSALLHYNVLLQYEEKTNNVNRQINTLRDMVSAYTLNEKYDNTLDFNLKIKQLLEENNYPNSEKVKIHNNIGYNYNQLKNYPQSISSFEKALSLIDNRNNIKEHSQKTILYTNIGVAYYNMGNFENSILHLLNARNLIKKDAPSNLDEIDQLLATVYLHKKDLYNALEYAQLAEKVAHDNQHRSLLMDVYYTLALIHSALYEYDIALEYYQKHLKLRDSFEVEDQIKQEKFLLQQRNLERTEKKVKLFSINEDIQELTIAQLKVEKENQELALRNKENELFAEQKKKEVLAKEKEILSKQKEILQKDNEISISQAEQAKQELELAQKNLKVIQQEKAYAALQQQEQLKELALQNKESQLAAEKNEKELLLQESKINTLQLQKQTERMQFFYGLGLLLALIILIIFLKNRAIEKQKKEISREREKADELLLNILPAQVATELKETGAATTKKYDNVSILFTDFKDFTVLVASIPATTLVKELNEIFSRFDEIMEEFQVEKIETIGDAYMAACGLPEENKDHALKCVKAAHSMVNFLDERNKTHKIQWKMRVGIHSGPVVAGVVGKKKFAYDIFGDTVNTASRIESNGEVGRINISQPTYELIKNHSHFSFENRGKVYAKGKGELEMWFVNENIYSSKT